MTPQPSRSEPAPFPAWALLTVAVLLALSAIASLLLVNSWRVLTIVLLALCVALAVGVGQRWPRLRLPAGTVLGGVAVGTVLLQANYWYPLLAILAIVSGAAAVSFLIGRVLAVFRRDRPRAPRTWVRLVMTGVPVLLLTAAVAIVGWFGIVPPAALLASVTGAANSDQPLAEPGEQTLADGTLYRSDIRYGDDYPNSFLDAYIADADPSTPRPTYIYVHGGGYIAGDKIKGDVYASGSDPFAYYSSFTQSGINVISINYAFAAEYPYPNQVIQMGQAVEYVVEHADELGVDPERLFVGGGSAGGQVAGQFALVQTDAAYAARVGIDPVVPGESIRGVLLNSSLLEPQRFDESGSPTIDWLWNVGGRAQWGIDFETNRSAALASIPGNVTEAYPPVFLSDGNVATFHEQALRFDALLTAAGHDHVTVLWEDDPTPIPHGYESNLNLPQAREALDQTLAFLTRLAS